MKRIGSYIVLLIAVCVLLLPEIALAAGEKAAGLVIVADTRKLSGWEKWFADLYNESHIYFTLLTVAVIPVIGLVFGTVADIIMSHIGIDLKSRELAEH